MPATVPPPCAVNVKELLRVETFIGWLNAAVTAAVTDTPVPPLMGVTAVTVGGTGGGGAAAVVKDHV